MNILYIHQYFLTPKEPGGTRSYWLAQELIKNGHSVTMLTTSTKFNDKVHSINIDGINVIYIKEAYSQKMSLIMRLKAFVSFMFKATFLAFKQKNIDLVFATSTPLTVGVPALILKKIKKIPYVFEVRDLWPDVPIQMGAITNSILIKLTVWLEKTIYKNAIHIIALSPGMEKGVLKFVKKDKVSVIPNMAKIDKFFPRVRNIDFLKSLKLKRNSFKIIHFGSLGLANGAHTILESAKLLENFHDIEFIFIGGGATENSLKLICDNYNLKNVHFLGKFAMDETSEIVNFCDISIVSFLDLPILYTNSPNKLFDSLSAGKPIIVNSNGWTRELVEKNKCGFYVNPNKPNELVDKILFLKNNTDIMTEMMLISRKLAEEVYDKNILCKKFVQTIEDEYHLK